jgi:hypothetical protein
VRMRLDTHSANLQETIIEFRKQIKKGPSQGGSITKETLQDFDIELRKLFFDIYDRATAPPQICNTDGDPLSLHRITYEIESPSLAFEALAPLSLMETQEEVLKDAVFDSDGRLSKIEFAWHKRGNKMHKEWDNTLMGRFTIDGPLLTIEVNSEKRAKRIKKEIETRLKGCLKTALTCRRLVRPWGIVGTTSVDFVWSVRNSLF